MKQEKKVVELSEKYGLSVDPDAKIENITVGMQQRTEILKMLYRDNEVLIFDEPTAVLTPQEINELMVIMKNLAAEGKSILFITHKLAEIMAVADRCSVLRKGKYIGTVDIKDTTPEKLSAMMVGRDVNFVVDKKPAKTGDVVLSVRNMTVASKQHKNNAVNHVSFDVRRGEIVCIAGIDGNGQSELVYGLSGLEPVKEGTITMNGQDITNMPIRRRITSGMSHIPEDRHKHGLVLDYSLEDNIVLERYFEPQFTNRFGFLKRKEIRKYANRLIKQYDIRSGQGPVTKVRSMSGGNQQKAIIAREIDKDPKFLIAVQPTRGLDVGAIEYIHKQIVAERDAGKGVLLVSLELDEVMNVSDRILVMYEGEIVGEFDPKKVSVEELGLYMAGSKRKGDKREWIKKQKLLRNNAFQTVLASLICIVIGLIVGFVVFLIISPSGAGKAIIAIMKNFFLLSECGSSDEIFWNNFNKSVSTSDVCVISNICLQSRFVQHWCSRSVCDRRRWMPVYGLRFNLPWYICLIAGVLIAAAVGGISGALKAYLNVNEVISCIMLNWISLYSVNMLLSQVKDGSTPYTKLLFSYNKKCNASNSWIK